jgi:2-dehydropantoate 2-reductase
LTLTRPLRKSAPVRIAVLGVGGIGGVFAASLTRAGHEVSPVARDPAARARLAAQGYRVTELDGRSWSVPLSAPPVGTLPEARAADLRPFDAVVVTTQSPALEEALTSAAPALSPDTIVVVCQNGLPEARAKAVLPSARVLGCVVGWGASMTAPGEYRRTSGGGLQLGDPDPGAPSLARAPGVPALLAALSSSGAAELSDNFAGVRWSKLAINSVTSTVGAIGGEPLGRLLIHAAVRRLALEIFTELAAVARAAGVRLAPVGGTLDISSVTLTPAERRARLPPLSLVGKHALLLAVGAKFRRMRSSMLYALERGRPPEIDQLNGEIARRGAALGVPTPVNAALVERVRAIQAGRERSSVTGLLTLARALNARGGA